MLTTLIGCNKNEDLTPSYASDGTEVFSSVAVFNAIPNSTGITMFMGQGNQQKAIITSSDKLVYGGYVGYKNWYTGSFELTIENQVGNTKALSVSEYVEVDISKLHDFNIQTIDGKLKLTMKGEEKLVNRGLYTLLLKGSTDVTGGNGNKEVMMLIKQ